MVMEQTSGSSKEIHCMHYSTSIIDLFYNIIESTMCDSKEHCQ